MPPTAVFIDMNGHTVFRRLILEVLNHIQETLSAAPQTSDLQLVMDLITALAGIHLTTSYPIWITLVREEMGSLTNTCYDSLDPFTVRTVIFRTVDRHCSGVLHPF